MNRLLKKTVLQAVIGFVLGIFVGIGFLFIGDGMDYTQHGPGLFALYLLLSGALGAVGVGGTTIYSLEDWSLLRCTAVHCALTLSAYCAVGGTLGWLDLSSPESLIMLLLYGIAYLIIWLIMYLIYQRKIHQINEALKKWKEHSPGD